MLAVNACYVLRDSCRCCGRAWLALRSPLAALSSLECAAVSSRENFIDKDRETARQLASLPFTAGKNGVRFRFSPPMYLIRFWIVVAVWVLTAASGLAQAVPQWIWHDNPGGSAAEGEVRYFRRIFNVASKVLKAELQLSADDQATVWINGKQVGSSSTWKKPLKVDVTDKLTAWGDNILAVRAKIVTGLAALLAVLILLV